MDHQRDVFRVRFGGVGPESEEFGRVLSTVARGETVGLILCPA